MGAIASDDVIIAASGLRLHAGPTTVLPIDLGFASTGSAHFLPLGGVLTGIFLSLVLIVHEHTSLSLPQSWGMLAWLSMLFSWRMVSHFILRTTNTARVFTTTLSVAALASILLQIPGEFNLNAVLSFPVAGWITTAIAVWTVTVICERQDKLTAPLLLALSCTAIVIYELLIVPILCATILIAVSNRLGTRRALFLVSSSSVALLIPLCHRLYYALQSPAPEYSGTALNTSSTFVDGIWLGTMSSVSAAPLGQLASAVRIAAVEAPNFSIRTLALACASCTFLWRKLEPLAGFRIFKLGSLVLCISAVLGGAVLGMTTKYAAHFSADFGRTYLNFPLASVGVVLAALNFAILIGKTKAGKFSTIGILFLLGSIHQSSNSSVADRYEDHWGWARDALEDVYVDSDELVLCRHYRTIASQPLPNVFSTQLVTQLDQFRQAQFAKGLCPALDRSRISALTIAGDVDKPEHYESGSWWWLIGDTFDFEFTFLEIPPSSIRIPVGSSPCDSPLVFRIGTTEKQVIEPNSSPAFLRIPLGGVDQDTRGFWSARINGHVSGSACLIDGEERTLVAPIFFPSGVVGLD